MVKNFNKLLIFVMIIIVIISIIAIVVYINHSTSATITTNTTITQKTNMVDIEYSSFIADDKNNVKIYQGDSLDFSYTFKKDSLLKEIKLITSGNLAPDSSHNGYALVYKNDNLINMQTDSFFTSSTMTDFKIPLGNDVSFKTGDTLKVIWNVKTGTSSNNSFYVYFSTLENKYVLPVVMNFQQSL